MDTKEFNSTAIRTETDTEVRVDVRPFGSRQGEAIDFYLHERVGGLQMGVDTGGSRVVVLLHDSSAAIPGECLQMAYYSKRRWRCDRNPLTMNLR